MMKVERFKLPEQVSKKYPTKSLLYRRAKMLKEESLSRSKIFEKHKLYIGSYSEVKEISKIPISKMRKDELESYVYRSSYVLSKKESTFTNAYKSDSERIASLKRDWGVSLSHKEFKDFYNFMNEVKERSSIAYDSAMAVEMHIKVLNGEIEKKTAVNELLREFRKYERQHKNVKRS